MRNLIATTINHGEHAGAAGASNRVLVLGGRGAGKSTFSEQLKLNGNFTTEDADSRTQDEMLGVLEVKKGALADRTVWSSMLSASRALLFVAAMDAVREPARLEETIGLFRKTFTSKKLGDKRVLLLLISPAAAPGAATPGADEQQQQQDEAAAAAAGRFGEAVADVDGRQFAWLGGRLEDDAFVRRVTQFELQPAAGEEGAGLMRIAMRSFSVEAHVAYHEGARYDQRTLMREEGRHEEATFLTQHIKDSTTADKHTPRLRRQDH